MAMLLTSDMFSLTLVRPTCWVELEFFLTLHHVDEDGTNATHAEGATVGGKSADP